MTKAELVESIAKSSKLSKADSEKALSAMVSAVINAVKKGDAVRLVGFGTFESISRKARTGRNPQTGKEIKIKASKAPKFRAGLAFKHAVNGK